MYECICASSCVHVHVNTYLFMFMGVCSCILYVCVLIHIHVCTYGFVGMCCIWKSEVVTVFLIYLSVIYLFLFYV